MPQTKADQLVTLWKKGRSKRSIAKELDVTRQYIYKILIKKGLHIPKQIYVDPLDPIIK